MSRVMLTKDEAASTKNSEGINMQEGPPKGDLEVRKGTPKVELDGPNTGVATTILKVEPREPRLNLKVNTHSRPTWGWLMRK